MIKVRLIARAMKGTLQEKDFGEGEDWGLVVEKSREWTLMHYAAIKGKWNNISSKYLIPEYVLKKDNMKETPLDMATYGEWKKIPWERFPKTKWIKHIERVKEIMADLEKTEKEEEFIKGVEKLKGLKEIL